MSREVCKDCNLPFTVPLKKGRCSNCKPAYDRESRELMTERALTTAMKDFSAAMRLRGKDAPDLIAVTRRLAEKAGGIDELTDIYWQEFEKVRNHEVYKPVLIHKYLQSMFKLIAEENATREAVGDWSDMSEADLQLVLQDVAAKAMRDDPEFLKRVLESAGTTVIEGESRVLESEEIDG